MKKEIHYGPQCDSDEEIKVLLPAWQIPEGATVTKPTGEKRYTLEDDLKVYGDYDVEITKDEDTRLLVNGNQINIISMNKKLGWVTSFYELYEILWMDDLG